MPSRRLVLRRLVLRRMSALSLAGLLPAAVPSTALAAQKGTQLTDAQIAEFFRAVQIDNTATVRRLLDKGFDPNAINPVGGEPGLVLALREDAMQVFQLLLVHPRIRVDTPAANGNTALMMAAFKRKRTAVEALILKAAALDRPGWTALHYAAAAGDADIAGVLLRHGASIDPVSPRASGSYTPLMMAAREGHADCVRFLAARGADAELRNGEGLNAAQIAMRAGRKDIVAALDEGIAARRREQGAAR